eukprot:scaffold7029_cov375-Pinguiococcus_pyrenoidosus.AAC.16
MVEVSGMIAYLVNSNPLLSRRHRMRKAELHGAQVQAQSMAESLEADLRVSLDGVGAGGEASCAHTSRTGGARQHLVLGVAKDGASQHLCGVAPKLVLPPRSGPHVHRCQKAEPEGGGIRHPSPLAPASRVEKNKLACASSYLKDRVTFTIA